MEITSVDENNRSISGGYGSGIAQLVAANQADYRYENVIVDTANSDTSDTTVDVSDNTDPFDGFEEAIKNSEVIRIRKNTPSVPLHQDVKLDQSSRPEVPVKKCSRSVSLISRASVQSHSSNSSVVEASLSHHPDVSHYRYDEVSLSSSFGKPVVPPEPSTPRVDDIFNGFSFTSPLKDVTNEEDDDEEVASDDPYEDIELMRKTLAKLPPPKPPPRSTFMVNKNVAENIYSDVKENVINNNIKNDTLMDDLMNDDHDNVEKKKILNNFGARPKNTMTMDIRQKISEWYEEAEKEVERDLSLDISQLENKKCLKSKRGSSKDPHEHISVSARGKLDEHIEIDLVPKPTMTLLRDFDPCYDIEENDVESDADCDVIDKGDNGSCEAIYDQIDEMKLSNDNSPTTEPDDLIDESKLPIVKPRTKFPLGSPKKLNFGPPKPPRNFNYSSKSPEPPKSGPSPMKGLRSMLSDSNLLRRDTKTPDQEDLCKKPDMAAGSGENIYITVPVMNTNDATSDTSDTQGNEAHSPSPPPPLPTSQPPTTRRGKGVTMYENVWVEPLEGPPLPPRANKPTEGIVITKTGKLEEIFSNRSRKMSQESLVSHGSSGTADTRLLVHKKTESIGSESSGSVYSETQTVLSKISDKNISSSNSLENLSDNLSSSSSPKKTKLKKFPSTRSFTVSNLTPKLNKLPEIASNLRRKMSDHIKTKENFSSTNHLAVVEHSSIFPETPEDSDHDNSDSMSTTSIRRELFTLAPSEQSNKIIGNGTRNHSGALHIWSRSKKQFHLKWCILGDGKFSWFNEDTSLAIPKESFLLTNIFSVTKTKELQQGPQSQELYCFDMSVLNSKGKYSVYILGALSSHDRETWLEKVTQSLSKTLSSFTMSQTSRLGWAYIKLGFAADWQLSWLSLSNRHLCYQTQHNPELENIDLKKLKDMFIRKDSKNLSVPKGFSKHPVLVCDFNDRSLYILVGAERECTTWQHSIETIAFHNSNVLRDQQVTHEDIPVIVDKCIKFVYSHGIMTEGIYRKAGSNININKLLSQFRSNAWAVQISREEYSEHDVANVLKRFIRQLDEPLLTEQLREGFLTSANIEQEQEKLEKYRELLNKLPAINYNTLRRLIGHLYIVGDQCEKNLMPVYNLAPLWGPNMMTVDGAQETPGGHGANFGQTSGQMEVFQAVGNISTVVCSDLISNYPWLFNVDNVEVEKERRMLEVLEKINFPTPTSMKRSGDIRMWIYIESRTCGQCISLVLHPSLTAGEACQRAGQEAGLAPDQLEVMFIHEVVMGGCLERPLHYSEKLLDVTLRWGAWEEQDRHDNYLLLKPNKFYGEALPCAIPPLSVAAEVMFSDNTKTRSKFNSMMVSVSNANITCFKEDVKSGLSTEVGAWPVEDQTWYLGSEPRRSAPHNLNITFIPKNGIIRTKESPMFGRVLSFNSQELFVKWIAALLVAEFDSNIVPEPSLINIPS